MGGDPPKARIAAVCFDKLDVEAGIPVLSPTGEERMLKHPWSVIAFQLAGPDGLRALHADGKDAERDTPPRDLLIEKVLQMPGKDGLATLILFDEVLMYAGEKAKDPVTGQQFREQFLNFLQSLTQAVSKVDTASLIVSLLASDPKRDDAFGRQLLSDMSNIMGRKEDEPFMPVGKDDVAEILRRRLARPGHDQGPERIQAECAGSSEGALGARSGVCEDPQAAGRTGEAVPGQLPLRSGDDGGVLHPLDQWPAAVPADPWRAAQLRRGAARRGVVGHGAARRGLDPAGKARARKSSPPPSAIWPEWRAWTQVDGPPQDWVAILQGELRFAREAQEQLPALANREIEQAVIGTFLHSQPQGTNHARITDLYALAGAAKPDRIALEKGIQAWAERSWFLDEVHLDSAEKRAGRQPRGAEDLAARLPAQSEADAR